MIALAIGAVFGWKLGTRNQSIESTSEPFPDLGPDGPLPDPMYRGKPLVYWRVQIKTRALSHGGWAPRVYLAQGNDELVLNYDDESTWSLAEMLIALARTDDAFIRSRVVDFLSRCHRARSRPVVDGLLRLLRDPCWLVRRSAADLLVNWSWDGYSKDRVTRWTSPVISGPVIDLSSRCDVECRIGGEELHWITDETNLPELRLGPDVEDNDLNSLSNVHSVLILDMSGSEVTDRGLMHLLPMQSLGRIEVGRTKITPAGQFLFQSVRPNVRFSRFEDIR